MLLKSQENSFNIQDIKFDIDFDIQQDVTGKHGITVILHCENNDIRSSSAVFHMISIYEKQMKSLL